MFPLVFGQTYKQALQIDIPRCYGNITFKFDSSQSYTKEDIQMDGCPQPFFCFCTEEPQIINFSILDNITNTFSITGQYYIEPIIEYNGNPDETYDPNENNKRIISFTNVGLTSTGIQETTDSNGISIDATKLIIIVFGILALLTVGILVIVKILKGGKEKKSKIVIQKQPIIKETKKVDNAEDVLKYLKELEEERRKQK
jgi:hypothetical protein